MYDACLAEGAIPEPSWETQKQDGVIALLEECISSIHKIWVWSPGLIKLGVVVHTCNLSAGEMNRKDPWGSLVNLVCLLIESQVQWETKPCVKTWTCEFTQHPAVVCMSGPVNSWQYYSKTLTWLGSPNIPKITLVLLCSTLRELLIRHREIP